MARRLPWYMRSKSPAQTAYCLIMHAGNDVGKAHKYVTRVGRLMKKPRGRPPVNDTAWLLLIADAIRRQHKHLGRDEQMRLAAEEAAKPEEAAESEEAATLRRNAVAATLRRMRRKLGDRTLTEFAEGEPFVAVRRGPGRYDLHLRGQSGEPIAEIRFPDKNPRKSD
jgi:hypothetical protein